MEYIELGSTIDPQQNIIIKISNNQKGNEGPVTLWNKTQNKAICEHFHEIGTLTTWLEFEKAEEDLFFCPDCKNENLVRILLERFLLKSKPGDFGITMAALLQERMSLLSQYVFFLFTLTEKIPNETISEGLQDNAVSWVDSFKRSVHYTEAKGKDLLVAVLRDLTAKKNFILRYYDKREAFEVKEQKRAVIEKNDLLQDVIASEFEREISGKTLLWVNLFVALNECFIEFIEILFDGVSIVTKDISVAGLLKGQFCMKMAFETGKQLDKFILSKS